MTTATTGGARDHARQQANTVVDTMATFPPSAAADRPADVEPEHLTWAETVRGGGYTSLYLAAGATLRLTDLDGDACAHLLAYNALQTAERLNVADTIKVQWQAYPTVGSLLLSDLGRALATISADSAGKVDTLCGATTLLGNVGKYGDGSPQGHSPAGRELFKLAAAKNGLDARDLPPSLSFFQGVTVQDGTTVFTGGSVAGAAIELVAELPLIVMIANTAHPLDPRLDFSCGRLRVMAWNGSRYTVHRSPEGSRALANTAVFLGQRGLDAALAGAR